MAFTHDTIRHYPSLVDRTDIEEVPPGWRRIVTELCRNLASLLAAHPRHKFCLYRMREKRGALQVILDVRHEGDDGLLPALQRLLSDAEAASRRTCRVCGAPGREHPDRGSRATLCDAHAEPHAPEPRDDEADTDDAFPDPDEAGTGAHASARDAQPSVVAAPQVAPDPQAQPGPFRLYDLRAVAAALGQPADTPDEDLVPAKTATEHEERLARILSCGEAGSWRHLARPDPDVLVRLAALDAAAPHMGAVTALVRRHVQAALVIGLPLSLPPIMLLGEPGMGKSWYLDRLGRALGAPTRTYPMAASTLGEGLQGAHPSWRNASPGLIAKTLLQESVANPLILVDEVDKPGGGSWGGDPYRPFYALLEPSSARLFRDEYLGFEMDASAILWMLAGNSVQPLPEPIRDRLSVLEIQPLSQAHLAAVAISIYGEVNASMKEFFAPALGPQVLDALLDLTPRAIRVTLQSAMVRAASAGRGELARDDLVLHVRAAPFRVGFGRNVD